MSIQHEIASFLVNTLKVADVPGRVDPDASLVETLGVDSAGVFELILWLEDRYAFHVPPADMDLVNFATVRAVESYVRRGSGGHDRGGRGMSRRNIQTGQPRAGVVVLTCGAAEVTVACLESVVAGMYDNLQLVVVCNGAGAEVEASVRVFAGRCAGRGVDVRMLMNETNVGSCAGRNQALAQVDGEYVAFIDNDIICHDPRWLNRAVDLLRSNTDVGMVGPRIVSAGQPPRLECAGYAIDPKGSVVPLGVGCSPDDSRYTNVRTVQAVGNFVSPTQTVRAIGGFDAAFDPFGFENIDCSCRMRAAGYAVIRDGESDLHHVGHLTTSGFDRQGRSILFSKSLLLRSRWRTLFEADRTFFEQLMATESPVERTEVSA